MPIIRRLFAATAGNATTLFALALVPVVCAAGAAVDYGHVTRVRAELTSALDRSLVDLGRHPPADSRRQFAELREGMENILDPALEAQWKIESLSEREGRLVAVVSAEVATSIARLVGIIAVPITVTAEVPRVAG